MRHGRSFHNIYNWHLKVHRNYGTFSLIHWIRGFWNFYSNIEMLGSLGSFCPLTKYFLKKCWIWMWQKLTKIRQRAWNSGQYDWIGMFKYKTIIRSRSIWAKFDYDVFDLRWFISKMRQPTRQLRIFHSGIHSKCSECKFIWLAAS